MIHDHQRTQHHHLFIDSLTIHTAYERKSIQMILSVFYILT